MITTIMIFDIPLWCRSTMKWLQRKRRIE